MKSSLKESIIFGVALVIYSSLILSIAQGFDGGFALWQILLSFILLAVFVIGMTYLHRRINLSKIKEILKVVERIISDDSLKDGFNFAAADKHHSIAESVNKLLRSVNNLVKEFSASQRELRCIIESIPIGIVILDDRGYVMEVNPLMQNWFPSLKDYRDKPFAELMDKAYFYKSDDSPMLRAQSEIDDHRASVVLQTRDGLRFFDIVSVPLKNPNGKTGAVVQTFTDMSEKFLIEHDIETKKKELTLLNEIISASNQSKDLQSLFAKVINLIVNSMEFEKGWGYIFKESDNVAELVYSEEPPDESIPRIIKLDEADNPIVNTLINKSPEFITEPQGTNCFTDTPKFKSLAVIPLIYAGKPLGVICFADTELRQFDSDEKIIFVRMMREVSNSVAIVLSKAELERSEWKYRDLFENANDIIFTADFKGDITSANKTALAFMGYTEADIKRGLNMARLLTDDSYRMSLERLRSKIAGIEVDKQFVLEAIKRNGEHVFLEYRTRILRDKHNKAVGVQGIARDITYKIKAEEKLRKSEEKYRALVESVNDIVFMVDQKEKYLYYSGKREPNENNEEIIGRKIGEFAKGNGNEALLNNIREIFRTKKPKHFEYESEINGERSWYSVSLSPLRNNNGIVSAVVGVSRDITSQKRLQFDLERKTVFLESLLKSTGYIIIALDNEFKIIYTGDSPEADFGLDSEDLIGRELGFLFNNPDEYPLTLKRIKTDLKEKGRFTGKIELADTKAKGCPCFVNVFPFIKGSDDCPSEFVATIKKLKHTRERNFNKPKLQGEKLPETIKRL